MKPDAPMISEYLTPLEEMPDEDELNNCLLEGLDLPNEDLHSREFRGCVFRKCRLTGAVFRRAGLVDVVLDHCDLSGACLEDAVMHRVRFDSCRLSGADMNGAVMRSVVMTQCKADYVNLNRTKAEHTLLSETLLREAAMEECILRQTVIDACDLTRAVIARTPMKGMDMRSCVLDGIVIGPGDMRGMIVTQEQAADLARMLGLVVK